MGSAKMREYKIALIPGDGIGPEVIESAVEVLKAYTKTKGTFDLQFTTLPWGSNYYREHVMYMPESGIESLKAYDAVLFGSVEAPGKLYLVISDPED